MRFADSPAHISLSRARATVRLTDLAFSTGRTKRESNEQRSAANLTVCSFAAFRELSARDSARCFDFPEFDNRRAERARVVEKLHVSRRGPRGYRNESNLLIRLGTPIGLGGVNSTRVADRVAEYARSAGHSQDPRDVTVALN